MQTADMSIDDAPRDGYDVIALPGGMPGAVSQLMVLDFDVQRVTVCAESCFRVHVLDVVLVLILAGASPGQREAEDDAAGAARRGSLGRCDLRLPGRRAGAPRHPDGSHPRHLLCGEQVCGQDAEQRPH